MEQTRQSNRIVKSIYDENKTLITLPDQILPTISTFYEKLMNIDVNEPPNQDKAHILNTFLGESAHPTLEEEDILVLEEPITIQELKEALKNLNSDSAPGCDGLTPSFYLRFWESIKKTIL